jgi:hypothetical protein
VLCELVWLMFSVALAMATAVAAVACTVSRDFFWFFRFRAEFCLHLFL